MQTKAVLFDLDGTLLPMDQDVFVKAYFKGIAKRLSAHGYEPEKLIEAIWLGTGAMIKNDGKKTNEQVFWETFTKIFGEKAIYDQPHFEAFYRENFDDIASVCGFSERASEVIKTVKEKGFKIALATNPIFPRIATEKRIKWAGLEKEDFALITTYENSTCSKPNPKYYLEITEKLGVTPSECVMVGNDVSEDMVAEKLGMKVFLLKGCIINKNDADISVYPNGDFGELIKFLGSL